MRWQHDEVVTLPPDAPAPIRTSPVPVLTDGTLTLRAHSPADADALLAERLDPQTRRWSVTPRCRTRQDALDFIDDVAAAWDRPDDVRRWAIERDGAYAGTITLRPGPTRESAWVGFAVHPDARALGVASAAIRLVAVYGFERGPWGAPLTRIHWRCIAQNWGSRKAAWANGFTFHGMIPASHPDPADPDHGPALDTWHGSLSAGGPMEPRTPWYIPPALRGEGFVMRPWRDDDIEAIEERDEPAHWVPVPSVLRRATFGPWLLKRRLAMADGTAVEWCVADAATDRMLGSVAVFSRYGPIEDGDSAELGYQLNPSARGRGVVTAAARLAVAHALRPREEGGLGLRRLTAQTAADNTASNAVLTRLGFVEFGREHAVDLLPDGSCADALLWELLPAATRS